ncbi:Ribonucleoside-diphosphate reductase 1 subunit alpha [Kluyvera cryocrescens]|uniref:Ribonucleoside-diphosphate reductase 1 subunit alpha n=1 Tax=Kluyvera cryocrescens TaxID=580 RepID=A0A485C2H7_KLUCR|nr:Ribonucleoside-diphosphate reductase 1 subunit alpha [Kluyvera cryocrescens]
MNQSLLVTKRDGRTERINLDKIHRVLDWAAEGLHNVSISQVELRSHIQFYDGMKTSDIHETIIKAAADLISHDAPDYQYLGCTPGGIPPAQKSLRPVRATGTVHPCQTHGRSG